MDYRRFLSGIKRSNEEVQRAKKSGVVLSRYEEFDYMFKRELGVIEGIIKERDSFLKRFWRSLYGDYNLARFYSEVFHLAMKTRQSNSYSYKGVCNNIKKLCKESHSKFVCSDRFIAWVDSSNNEYRIKVKNLVTENVYSALITNKYDYISALLSLASLLGSNDEETLESKEWFENYLYGVYDKVYKGVKAEPYVEKRRVNKQLNSFLSDRGDNGLYNLKELEAYPCVEKRRGYKQLINFPLGRRNNGSYNLEELEVINFKKGSLV